MESNLVYKCRRPMASGWDADVFHRTRSVQARASLRSLKNLCDPSVMHMSKGRLFHISAHLMWRKFSRVFDPYFFYFDHRYLVFKVVFMWALGKNYITCYVRFLRSLG